MGWPDAAEGLLAAPRGRRLCWSLLEPSGYTGWDYSIAASVLRHVG